MFGCCLACRNAYSHTLTSTRITTLLRDILVTAAFPLVTMPTEATTTVNRILPALGCIPHGYVPCFSMLWGTCLIKQKKKFNLQHDQYIIIIKVQIVLHNYVAKLKT